jgi:hypothetical protein
MKTVGKIERVSTKIIYRRSMHMPFSPTWLSSLSPMMSIIVTVVFGSIRWCDDKRKKFVFGRCDVEMLCSDFYIVVAHAGKVERRRERNELPHPINAAHMMLGAWNIS